MFKIARLNHAVLYVRDAQASFAFYRDVLGFRLVEAMGEQAVFLRAGGSENHHDLGLFGIGAAAPGPGGGRQVGLYHLAWEVEALPELAEARVALLQAGAMTGESDHGSSLSLYGKDPDGNEFEVFWLVPREEWATRGFGTRRLDLEGELRRRTAAEAGAGS
ncbi:MAG: VOC family protein [Dehalococcoidia bacterium]|nr:VOC family protein [Dehalococcoidia bacterium]